MKDPLASRDNGRSFAGLYGLSNPIVTWLIGRGRGELVALTPEQLKTAAIAPTCPRCYPLKRMLYRTDAWVCYEHREPTRIRHKLALQDAPTLIDYGDGPEPFSGSLDELLLLADKEVDVVYSNDDGRGGRWKYVVRP